MAYQTIPIPIATGGLNKDLQPTQLQNQSPNMINMIVENWGVRKRLGYTLAGDNLPIPGIGMELIQYIDAVGVTHQIACTSTCIFKFDDSASGVAGDFGQWLNICDPTVIEDCEDSSDWTADESTVATEATIKKVGTNSLKMTVDADVADGALLAYVDFSAVDITSDNMITYWVRCNSALSAGSLEVVLSEAANGAKSGTHVVTSNPLAMTADTWYNFNISLTPTAMNAIVSVGVYSNHATELDAKIVYLDDIKVTAGFTGDTGNRWSHTIATDTSEFSDNSGTALILSNNVDLPQQFEGGDNTGTIEALDISDFIGLTIIKEVIEFWNHFFGINYNSNIRNVAYTDLGDIVDWTTGTSGANALTDTRGKLLRAKKLGSDMIIYSEGSITTCRYYGGNILFLFPTLVYETGLFAEKTLWDFVNVHYLLGTDKKIYGYYGGQQLLPIGQAIEDVLFGEINIANKQNTIVGLDTQQHKLYVSYPGSGDTYAKKSYVYNYKQIPPTWEYHEFAHSVRDMSILTNLSGWYADGPELAGTYADTYTLYADASFTQSGHPTTIFLTDDGYIFKLNESGNKDYDKDISCIYETHDLTIDGGEHRFRTVWVSFSLMSTVVNSTYTIAYSINGGDSNPTWTTIEENASISSGAANSWMTHRHPFDIDARQIRFRITQTSDTDLQIRASHIELEILGTR